MGQVFSHVGHVVTSLVVEVGQMAVNLDLGVALRQQFPLDGLMGNEERQTVASGLKVTWRLRQMILKLIIIIIIIGV